MSDTTASGTTDPTERRPDDDASAPKFVLPAAIVALVLAGSAALGRWFEVSNRQAVANGDGATMQGPMMYGLFALMLPIVVLIVYGAQLGSAVAVARMRREAERERPLAWWPSVAGAVGTVVLILLVITAVVIGLGLVLTDLILSNVYPDAYRTGAFDATQYLAVGVVLLACSAVAALPATAIATAVARQRLGISTR